MFGEIILVWNRHRSVAATVQLAARDIIITSGDWLGRIKAAIRFGLGHAKIRIGKIRLSERKSAVIGDGWRYGLMMPRHVVVVT